MSDPIKTPLGGVVRLDPLAEHITEQIGGPGAMLRISMADPSDTRYAEIVLSQANLAELVIAAEMLG